MKKVLVLVEGPSEERFVKDVLYDHLFARDVCIIPKLIVTKFVRAGANFKGGINSFGQFQRDLSLLLRDTSAHVVTSLIDLYKLPNDFPKFAQSLRATDVDRRIEILSVALKDHFGDARFAPYFSVHEYEALTLIDPQPFVDTISPPHDVKKLTALCSFPDPEIINTDEPPAIRIKKLVPKYNKHLHGAIIIAEHGLARVRRRCPRFDAWLTMLEGVNSI